MKLTKGMLDAMLTALCELEAAGEPQGYSRNSPEGEKVMRNGSKAQAWIHKELKRRADEAEAYKLERGTVNEVVAQTGRTNP